MVSVAWRLSMIDDRLQDQGRLDEDVTGINTIAPRTVLGSSPDEDVFCNSETKHDKMAQRSKEGEWLQLLFVFIQKGWAKS
jgi:hypothetical protein